MKLSQKRTLVIAAGVVFVVATFVNWPRLNTQLHAWNLLPNPERLTELYYSDHLNLPTTYRPGVTQTFAFTVHNLEYRPTDYHFAITAETDSDAQPLGQGDITLNHDGSYQQSMTVTPPELGDRVKIVTTLTFEGIELGSRDLSDQTQTIHYWVEREGA